MSSSSDNYGWRAYTVCLNLYYTLDREKLLHINILGTQRRPAKVLITPLKLTDSNVVLKLTSVVEL